MSLRVRFWRIFGTVVLSLITLALPIGMWAGTAGKVLRSFSPTTGTFPIAAPAFDSSGALYGTTTTNGTLGNGSVYKLTPTASGPWKLTIAYSFDGSTGGAYAYSGVILDSAKNIYGTTAFGGANNAGEVYELSPLGGGKWMPKTLWSFSSTGDGFNPMSCLVFDVAGNLYGTTFEGGAFNLGTVYKLSPNGSGGWTETVIYSFGTNANDGSNPLAAVTFDSSGNLYGTTSAGGSSHQGTVFKLSPSGSTWIETILYNFTGLSGDGSAPQAGVVFDTAGNLYGTTISGGMGGQGVAYKLTPGVGFWTEQTLHSFRNNGHDGFNPMSTLAIDPSGNLYGTCANGGMQGKGIVFELLPAGNAFTSRVLRSFSGTNDGSQPYSGVILDSAGNIYGTTTRGGSVDGGVVYRLTP
jgi:uncharacterized repeat protein (TIGR03803 family)